MKKQFFLTLSLLVGSNVFADSLCSDTVKCVTTGTGVVAATGSGIYTAKKYSESNSIEKQFTIRMFQPGDEMARMEIVLKRMTEGDKVTIMHQLSAADNRQYHIDLMESHASSARSNAAMYAALAVSATRTVSDTDSNGNTTYRTEPDTAARASYAIMAASEASDAMDYTAKANDARHGGPVPTYDLEHIVAEKTGTQRLAGSFVDEKVSRGGKILSVDVLPAAKFAMVKSAVKRARGGLAGVALGIGFAAEEAISGSVANELNKEAGIKINDY